MSKQISFPLFALSFLIIGLFGSCSKDEADDELPTPGNPSTECQTDDVTYSGTVKPILTDNCTGCHSGSEPAGNIDLTDFDEVKKVVDDGRLVGSISHDSGFSAMPQGGSKLSDCNIDKIKAWVDNGALNN